MAFRLLLASALFGASFAVRCHVGNNTMIGSTDFEMDPNNLGLPLYTTCDYCSKILSLSRQPFASGAVQFSCGTFEQGEDECPTQLMMYNTSKITQVHF